MADLVFEDSGGETNLACDCNVTEEIFPCFGKCYVESDPILGDAYKKNCHHCSIWTSLPDGASLVVTHIFECSLYGYGRRVKD